MWIYIDVHVVERNLCIMVSTYLGDVILMGYMYNDSTVTIRGHVMEVNLMSL
jgi:hypothetical protein